MMGQGGTLRLLFIATSSQRFMNALCVRIAVLCYAVGLHVPAAVGQPTSEAPRTDILSGQQWLEIDRSAARGLQYLASQQREDGSFASIPAGQPGVTSLVTLAFLSQGHLPGQGPYGDRLDKALAYILRCQRRNGLLALMAHNGPVRPTPMDHELGSSAAYNHPIAGLALSELYGMTGNNEERLLTAIQQALSATLKMQRWPKSRVGDEGGWRYLHPFNNVGSDLSLVGWNLKFLRSAKNAGFRVPDDAIDQAVAYVMRCYDHRRGTFEYEVSPEDRRTRAMAGAGILALAHTSRHNSPQAKSAADWILTRGFADYNQQQQIGNFSYQSDRYHYGVFYCCMAMYQMGGRHWEEFYPVTSRTLIDNQNGDGSWAAESVHDTHYGRAYTTSLIVMALGAPNQLLPIYQR